MFSQLYICAKHSSRPDEPIIMDANKKVLLRLKDRLCVCMSGADIHLSVYLQCNVSMRKCSLFSSPRLLAGLAGGVVVEETQRATHTTHTSPRLPQSEQTTGSLEKYSKPSVNNNGTTAVLSTAIGSVLRKTQRHAIKCGTK